MIELIRRRKPSLAVRQLAVTLAIVLCGATLSAAEETGLLQVER